MLSFASSVPPMTTIFMGENGINVEVNIMEAYEFGEARWSVIHLFNETSGYQITNITNNNISCNMYLRNSQGFEIMDVEATVHEDHWDLNGSTGGSNDVGIYAWTLACKDGDAKVGGYASGFFEITANGKTTPEGIIIIAFSIILLLILSGSVVIIIKAMGHMINKDFDLMDLGTMWGMFFGLLGINQLAHIYLGNVEVNVWLELFIKIYALPMVVVPIIALLLSIFNMEKQKKEKAKQW